MNLSHVDSLLRLVDREMWVVTAAHEGQRAGLTATWVSQASLDVERPTMLVGLAPNHATTSVVLKSGYFGLHLLGKGESHVGYQFASSSSAKVDKFAGFEVMTGEHGTPRLKGCVAWLECRVIGTNDTGDRVFVWGDVVAGEGDVQGEPLRQSEFFAALTEQEKQVLRADRAKDVDLQRPWGDAWRMQLQAQQKARS